MLSRVLLSISFIHYPFISIIPYKYFFIHSIIFEGQPYAWHYTEPWEYKIVINMRAYRLEGGADTKKRTQSVIKWK